MFSYLRSYNTQDLNDALEELLNSFDETNHETNIEEAMGFVREGANPDTTNLEGATLLHMLAKYNQSGSNDHHIEELVRNFGANINLCDDEGKPVLEYLNKSEVETTVLMIKLGAKDSKGNSMLPLLERDDLTHKKIVAAYYLHHSRLLDVSLFKERKIINQTSATTVVHCKNNRTSVAVKEINRDARDVEEFIYEARIMLKLSESNAGNLVKFVGVDIGLSAYKIVMEYMCNGDMYHLIESTRDVDWVWREIYMQEVVDGAEVLHQLGILHCDLTCGNLLLDANYHIKVADYGNALFHEDSDNQLRTTCTHCPPEILKVNGANYSVKSDIYSLGIVMWEILEWKNVLRQFPVGYSDENICAKYQSGWRPTITMKDAGRASLIKRCWAKDPDQRPVIADVQETLKRLKA